jgi:hypothetical protein
VPIQNEVIMAQPQQLEIIKQAKFRTIYDNIYLDTNSVFWGKTNGAKHKKFNWRNCLRQNGYQANLNELELKYDLQHSDFRKVIIIKTNFANANLENSILPQNIDYLNGLGDPSKLRKIYMADDAEEKCIQPYSRPKPHPIHVNYTQQPRITDFFAIEKPCVEKGIKRKLEQAISDTPTNNEPTKNIKLANEEKIAVTKPSVQQ